MTTQELHRNGFFSDDTFIDSTDIANLSSDGVLKRDLIQKKVSRSGFIGETLALGVMTALNSNAQTPINDEDKDVNEIARTPKKRVQGGVATTDLVLSAYTADNSEVFPKILNLWVQEGSVIADVTYGKGVFWKNIDTSKYTFLPSDIKTGVDARHLPYPDNHLDAAVLDPPYMEGLYRQNDDSLAGAGSHESFRNYYSNSQATTDRTLKYHDKVIDMYLSIGLEVRRCLKDNAIFIVKCQDEVSANRQKLTHVELIYAYEKMGFYCEDLFVVVRSNKPVVSRIKKQVHARKNHSYFLVFRLFKDYAKKLPYSNFGSLLDSYKLSR